MFFKVRFWGELCQACIHLIFGEGLLTGMGKLKNVLRSLVGRPEGKISLGRQA
jgi:hypothetical protein